MRINPHVLPVLVAGALSILPARGAAGSGSEGATEPPSEDGRQIISQVWYRRPSHMFNLAGDLSIGEEGLQLRARKKVVRIDFEAIRTISFGKLKGDVDTEWAVLEVGEPGATQIVAFRDGKGLGYGERTREIFEAIRDAVKASASGQYRVPPGHHAYETLGGRFTLAVPDGWDARAESMEYAPDGFARAGVLVFSLAGADRARDAPSFFVRVAAAPSGAGCKRIKEKGRRELLSLAAADPLLASARLVLEEPSAEAVSISGCSGLRIEARALTTAGSEARLDLRAVVHRDTLFVFGVRAPTEGARRSIEALETALESLRFSVAR